jgi:hypothetical protein
MLWSRTGAGNDAFSPHRTHGLSLDFIDRHPRIKRCVDHIWKEYGSNPGTLKRLVPLGYASAFLYLMAAGGTQYDDYHDANKGYSEGKVKWDLWDSAVDFWTNLGKDPNFEDVRKAITQLPNQGIADKATLLAKAWTCHLANRRLTVAAVMPRYKAVDMGNDVVVQVLDEHLTFDGIDMGDGTPVKTKGGTGAGTAIEPEDQPGADADEFGPDADEFAAPADEPVEDDFGFGPDEPADVAQEDPAANGTPADEFSPDAPAAEPEPEPAPAKPKRKVTRKP